MTPVGTATSNPTRSGTAGIDEVDRILAEGRSLPAQFFTDQRIRDLEDELIFKRDWQLVCTEFELKEPGDYVTVRVASTPVVVVRDKVGAIKAFINVCRHRGNVLMRGDGTCKNLRCGYHGWTYGLDGSLVGVPFRREGNLPPVDTLSLSEVHVDTFGGFVFVALEPQVPLLEQLGDLPDLLERFDYDFPFGDPRSGLQPLPASDGSETTVRTNWKVFVENGQECYHCPTIHADTFGAVCDINKIEYAETTEGRFGSVARINLRDEVKARYSEEIRRVGGHQALMVFTFWPNVQIFSGYFGDHVLRFEPAGPSAIRYTMRSYARPAMSSDVFAELADIVLVQTGLEDIDVVEGVQLGLESGYYQPGPLMKGPEAIIRSFERQVWDVLRPSFA